MVETARPVDHDVGESLVQTARAADGPSTVGTNVVEQAVENGTVLANIDYGSRSGNHHVHWICCFIMLEALSGFTTRNKLP